MSQTQPVIMLCDNGSKRVQASIQLRRLAQDLADSSGLQVHPVSLQHADHIDPAQLDGVPAEVFRGFMTRQLEQGWRQFIVLPLFFGNSRALTSFIPEQVQALREQFGDFTVQVADVIYPLPEGEPLLTEIIYDHVHDTASQHDLPLNNLVLVDHGSPIPRVTEVRKHVAQTVQQRLPEGCMLEQAVMERRAGKEYDFNGELLQDWLTDKAEGGATSAIVVLLFFLPGRHAGAGGDIVEICDAVIQQHAGFKVVISPLIGEHPGFVTILQRRLQDVMGR